MVVFAHPDDAEYGSSGTAAQWRRLGWQVVYVVCTDGSKGSDDPEMTQEKLVALRKQEQRNAAKILGLKTVEFLNYPDSYLTPSLELRRDIAKMIRKHKPDVLICPNPNRDLESDGYIGHPDHMAAGEAALAAVFPTARDRLTYPDLLANGYEPHKVREVWVMAGRDRADQFVELTEEDLDKSIQALRAHASQVSPNVGEHMREWKARNGEPKGLKWAEVYKRFKLG